MHKLYVYRQSVYDRRRRPPYALAPVASNGRKVEKAHVSHVSRLDN